MAAHRDAVHWLLDEAGGTYTTQAEIPLADRPAPLYRLLVLATLLTAEPDAAAAVAGARSLAAAGLRTPTRMTEALREERVGALAAAGCQRLLGTADALAAGARRLVDAYRGDLRRLRERSGGRPARIRRLLAGFAGMGEEGAALFSREAQAVWPELRPSLDPTVLTGARLMGLPCAVSTLTTLVPGTDLARLAHALARVASDPRLAARARAAGFHETGGPTRCTNSGPSASPIHDTASPIATP